MILINKLHDTFTNGMVKKDLDEGAIKFISNQCALDVSVISGKPEVHTKFFSGNKTFQKCDSPCFKFYPSKLIIKFSPYGVMQFFFFVC